MNPFPLRRGVLLPLALTALSLVWLSTALAAPEQQALSCINALPAADPSATVCISRVTVPFNGASADNQFYVSWRSLSAESGQVRVVGGGMFEDVRGASYSGKTHYVQVNNLNAKTTYEFDIVSGEQVYTRGGAHWSAKLGSAVSPGTPYVVYGRAKNPDGSSADGVIVLAQVRNGDGQGTQGRSSLLSALVVVADGGDLYNINLDDARTQDNSARYNYSASGDKLFVAALGPSGSATKTFQIDAIHPPAPPPSLVLSDTGTGSAVTATATLPAPSATATVVTETPTFTPSPTVTHTPLPTETALPPATATPVELEPTGAAATEASIEETDAPEETQVAANLLTPGAGSAAGEEVEPARTRVVRGVPELPTQAVRDESAPWVTVAVVLIIGAGLLGAAAFFITKR